MEKKDVQCVEEMAVIILICKAMISYSPFHHHMGWAFFIFFNYLNMDLKLFLFKILQPMHEVSIKNIISTEVGTTSEPML